MRLKHVLFSGLLLSVGFAACTNDEFTEAINAPVNTSEAIALGENFTIKVGKAGADTRAAFGENFAPYWEKDDALGAAWVHQVTEIKNGDEVVSCGPVGGATTYGGFYSNDKMVLTEGEGTNSGTFATADESDLFAGVYVLYSPYTKGNSMSTKEIPVTIQSYNFDAAEPLKNISDNMFSYSPVKFVPGGNQSGEFMLHQVPVLFRLHFTAGENLNQDLIQGGIEIQDIVIEAKKGVTSVDNEENATDGTGVLVNKGVIVTTGNGPDKDDYNAPDEDDALAGIVTYEKSETTDHLFITAEGTNNDDYKMLVKGEMTKKPFVFSILPFEDEANYVVVKVVTDKGTYKTVFYGNADKKYLDEFNNAAIHPTAKDAEGNYRDGERQVYVNVVLDVTVKDNVIYTAEEFAKKWSDAVDSDEAVTLKVGTPLTLTEGLICNNREAEITIDGHALTMPSLNIKGNKGITFKNEVIVEGDVFTTGASNIEISKLTAGNVEIQGQAKIGANQINKLTVAATGIVELAAHSRATSTEPAEIGEIDVQAGTATKGRLIYNPANIEVEKLTSAGSMTLEDDMVNTGDMTLGTVNVGTHNFTNEGTVTLTGTFTGAFTNAAGATLTVDANQDAMTLTNSAATDKLPAGIVNIAEDATLSSGRTTPTLINNGTINVSGTLVEGGAATLTMGNEDARINAMSADARITLSNGTSLEKGYVVIVSDDNITNRTLSNVEPIAYDLKATSNVTVPTKANNIFVNCDVKTSDLTTLSINNEEKTLTFFKNITVDSDTDVTCAANFIVGGNVTIKTTAQNEVGFLITNGKTNQVNKAATLTLTKNVRLGSSTANTNLNVYGTFDRGEGSVGSNVVITYPNN